MGLRLAFPESRIRITLVAVPDPLFLNFYSDPDPTFHFTADLDSTFHFNATPMHPAPHQSNANRRPLVYRPSGGSTHGSILSLV
jgi:hypothetical protein